MSRPKLTTAIFGATTRRILALSLQNDGKFKYPFSREEGISDSLASKGIASLQAHGIMREAPEQTDPEGHKVFELLEEDKRYITNIFLALSEYENYRDERN